MTLILQNAALIIGGLLLLASVVLVCLKNSNTAARIMMLVGGIGLVFFGDPRGRGFEVTATGIKVTREELGEVQQDYAKQIATLASQLEIHKRGTEAQEKFNISVVAKLEELKTKSISVSGAINPSVAPSLSISPSLPTPQITKQSSSTVWEENTKFSVLVFYRPDQREQAEMVTAALLKAGYQSSATQTALSDLTRVQDQPSGTVLVVTKNMNTPILNRVQDAIKQALPQKTQAQIVINPKEVNLSRGDVQLLFF
jgi:hypothetical protein